MDESMDTKADLVSELERLRHRLAARQASEARDAWTRAQMALADGPLGGVDVVDIAERGADVADALVDADTDADSGDVPAVPDAGDVLDAPDADDLAATDVRAEHAHPTELDARLIQLAPVALVHLDVAGDIVACNRACLDLFGYGAGDLDGRPFGELLRPAAASSLGDGLDALIRDAGAPPCRLDAGGRRKDGSVVWVGLAAAAMREHGGPAYGLVISVEDRSERREVEAELRGVNDRLTRSVADLEQRSREHGLVSETGDLLQACRTADEAYEVIACMGRRLFGDESGSVSVTVGANNVVEVVASWGTPPGSPTFGSDACWALRRGRLHLVQGPDGGPRCRHMPASADEAYLCVPMLAYGEAVGLLTLGLSSQEMLSDAKRRLATTVAEHLALALANLRLQETLRSQSIRDPLTGLFNRRYMEESLEREMRRARRARHPVGVIMLDLDHFKPFNDTHGHEVGDALLREVGAVLQRSIRSEDIACRFGGEEFILILPEASLADAAQRAEQIRDSVRSISIMHGSQPVGPVTVSLGVALYPDDGPTADAVLRTADTALYAAKAEGRNRVVVAPRP